MDKKFLKSVDTEAVDKACEGLHRMFVWSGSPQGHKAWSTVYWTLRQIREEAEEVRHAAKRR